MWDARCMRWPLYETSYFVFCKTAGQYARHHCTPITRVMISSQPHYPGLNPTNVRIPKFFDFLTRKIKLPRKLKIAHILRADAYYISRLLLPLPHLTLKDNKF